MVFPYRLTVREVGETIHQAENVDPEPQPVNYTLEQKFVIGHDDWDFQA
jgi:hypothetical protein